MSTIAEDLAAIKEALRLEYKASIEELMGYPLGCEGRIPIKNRVDKFGSALVALDRVTTTLKLIGVVSHPATASFVVRPRDSADWKDGTEVE